MVSAESCRSRRETQRVIAHGLQLEADLESRHLDSVFLSKSIDVVYSIDFYPPSDSACPINVSAIQAGSVQPMTLGAVRRVTVETRQDATATRIIRDSVCEHRELSESDFKSVDESQAKERFNTLPLAVGIASLIVAACSFILYRRRKKA